MDEACASNLGVKSVAASKSEYHNENKETEIQKPIHKFRDSFLSSPTNWNKNKGFLTLFPILVIWIVLCMGLESIAKYGVLIYAFEVLEELFIEIFNIPSILTFSGLVLFFLFSYGLELLLLKGVLNGKLALILIISSLTTEILALPFAVSFIDSTPVHFMAVLCYLSVFLKLISYHVENYFFRKRIAIGVKTERNISLKQISEKAGIADKDLNTIEYPDNLNLKDLFYFLFVPTLCYELNFPVTPNIRIKFLAMRLLEILILLVVLLCVIHQIFIPNALEYQYYYQRKDYINYAIASIKCFIINCSSVMPFYYLFFHSIFNAAGEITRFGDKFFYRDWWNSCTMEQFWKTWNITVNRWATRYLYMPLLSCGLSKFQAACAVFFVSALLHEYALSVPLRTVRFEFFLLMIGQIPLLYFTRNLPTSQAGNIVIWLFFHVCGILFISYLIVIPAPPALKNRIL